MSDKHYDSSYLESTGQILKGIKESSYSLFKTSPAGLILDLGCGTGSDVVRLAELRPDAKIVGVDHDPDMLERARQLAVDKKNVDFILSEAYPLAFETESVTGVRTERMIQHLPEPEKVFGEIHRVLCKDCPLVIVETDWRSLSFYIGHTPIEKKVSDYLTEVKVKNGVSARNLTTYLSELQYKDIKIELFPVILRSLSEANEYLWFEVILNEAAEKGYITHTDCDIFRESLKRADHNAYFLCSINLIVVSAYK